MEAEVDANVVSDKSGYSLATAPLDAAGVRSAVGLASANLDTQLDALPTNAELATALGTADDATLAAIAALNNLSAAQVNAEVDTALADVGLTGTVTGRIDAAISSRLAAGSYTAPLDAAGTRSALGMASANLDTQLAAIAGYIDTEVAAIMTALSAIQAKTDNLPASPAAVGSAMILTSGERDAIAAALLDLSAGVETGMTVRQAQRLILAALVGKLSGAATTTISIRDTGDSKNRIVATVDADGNRTSVTLDGS
jgi:hypothetical protein